MVEKSVNSMHKEQEQSEYERREKEHERIAAHESIVEREIRLQREKEAEVARQRGLPISDLDHCSTHTPSEISISSTEAVSPPFTETHFSKPPEVSTSLHSMSDSRDTLSPDSGVASVDTKLVTYEEALSSNSHRGESIIAKELREQKEREEELRKRWTDMGVDSPYVPPQAPDTPFNQPEPQQPKPIPGHTSSAKGHSMINGNSQSAFTNGPTKGGFYQQGIKSYMSAPGGNNVRRGSTDSDRSHSSAGDGPVKAKEEENSQGYNYQPRNETPIEREIRLARQREEELRIQKGLSPRIKEPENHVVYQVKDDNNARRPQNLGQTKDKAPLKHFTTGRLQYEIKKKKVPTATLR